MARLHEAVGGFDLAAGEYERGRPEYPADAVDYLQESLPIRAGKILVELASGTGKLTRALQRTGARIVAVEPTQGMRRVFAQTLPQISLVAGTAEAIPIGREKADAVVVGQAFHWFRPLEAFGEVARILPPGAGLALVWNMRDESVPWVARLGGILREHEAKEVPKGSKHAWKAVLASSELFDPASYREFHHSPMTDPEGLVARVLSVSYVAMLPPQPKADVVRQVRELLQNDPALAGRDEFEFPYRTEVYWTRRR